MNLAILTHYWRSSRGGGINTYVTELVNMLNKTFHNTGIKIIFIDGDDNSNYKISKRLFVSTIESFVMLIRIKPDVIHVHESFELLVGAALYRILHKNARLVYTFHTEPQQPVRLVKKINKRLKKHPYQWALNRCDCITFVNKDLQRKIESVVGFTIKTKTAVTYAGVERKEISNEDAMKFRGQFRLDQTDIVLLSQAMTADRRKAEGTKVLISAIKRLKTKYPRIKLLITKDGRYKKELEDYSNGIGIGNSIIFTGDIDNPFIAIEVADIFCYVAELEGVSIALLEGMIMRKPIVATKAPEVIIDEYNGLLVGLDSKSVAAGISKLMEDKKFASHIGENAYKTAIEQFNWSITVKKLFKIYSEIG